MKHFFFLLIFSGIVSGVYAQKIHGIVFNEQGDLLPFSSVTIKGTTQGASANERARFLLNLKPGTYTVLCQHIGYAAQEKKVVLGNQDEEISFVLRQQKLDLKEVVVRTSGEDPAYAIIRQAIKKRPFYNEEVSSFSCDLYSKDMIKLRKLPKKLFGQKIPDEDRREMGLDTSGVGIVYLSEAISSVAMAKPDLFKMQVKSSRVSGSNGFGFTFPAFISFYKNNVVVFTEKLNPRGFVSPIADNALNFYKFKFLGSFWENGKEINSIRVTPRRLYEPLFSGVINITEGDWRIHSLDLKLSKKAQLEILDTLQVVQFHVPAGYDTWRVKNQLLRFDFAQFGLDVVGNFVNVYSDYQVNRTFAKGFFDNVIIKYDTGLNKKPKAYWDSIRPVPLEKEELRDYQVKDSLFEVQRDSMLSKRSIDSLKKKQGGVNPLKIFWGGINRTHYSAGNTYRWGIAPMIPILEYNTAEGVAINFHAWYRKFLIRQKSNLIIEPNLRYGLNNKHLNGWVDAYLRTRNYDEVGNLNRHSWNFSAGTKVLQFNRQSPITPLINSISTLFYGQNHLKNYEMAFAQGGYSHTYENGLKLDVQASYEDRKPLNNTTDFTFRKKDRVNLTVNYPYEILPAQFNRHQAVILSVDLSYKPGQKYIQFPSGKVPVGSKYPTFTFNYTKGINGIFGSDVNFDKWQLAVKDDVNMRLAGSLRYKVGIGGFLNNKRVFIQDYQHFNGNLTVAASEYVNSFQMAGYYTNSTTAGFYVMGHLEHHFNGLLTNKIPGFRKLNWYLVTGTNTFYVNKDNHHIEAFFGLENIAKLFRVDFVMAFVDKQRTLTGIRIGAGGLLGSSISASGSSGNRSLNISF